MNRFSFKPRLEALEDRFVPSTLDVGTGEQFTTITAALAAANPGDTINVAPGDYHEQVLIDKNSSGIVLNNIKLIGANQTSIIDPTVNSQTAALVEVSEAQNVTISGFKVTGPGASNSGSIGFGILVHNDASATITNDLVTNIRDNPISGAQNGIGIFVGGSTPGSADIFVDTISNYQKGGIVVNGVGSSANVHDNVVTGSPDNSTIPSNGIQFGRGATGNITDNKVTDNTFKGVIQDLGFEGVGILLFKPGKVNVRGNTVTNNDIGIWDFAAGNGTIIQRNTASFNTFDGIVLEETGNAPTNVSRNVTDNNGHDGIEFIFDTTGAESGTPDSLGNHKVHVIGNTASNNGNDGVEVDSHSTGNHFIKNTMKGNGLLDAQDHSSGSGTAHTGNLWKKNRGEKSDPEGLVH